MQRKPRRFFWWQVAGLVAVLGFFLALNHASGPARELTPTPDQLRELPAMGRPVSMTPAERLEREARLIEHRNAVAEYVHKLELQREPRTGPTTTPWDGVLTVPPQ